MNTREETAASWPKCQGENKRSRKQSALRLLLILLGVLALACPAARALAEATAVTDNFAESGGIPTGARTTFHIPLWTNGDATNTAHHELLHAIGFAVAYAKFAQHVDGSRSFRQNANGSGSILAKLTPAANGTHIDPTAGVVNGFNQADSVMGPFRVAGQRMGPQERSVEDAAFGWSTKNIRIVVAFSGTWSAAQRTIVNDAVTAAKKLLKSDETGPSFAWQVQLATSSAVAGSDSKMEVSSLIADAAGEDPALRTKASAAILAGGATVVPQLEAAGAKPMTGLTPSRLDVLYSAITGEHGGHYTTNSLGIHLEPGTTLADVKAMGERSGFVVPDSVPGDLAGSPSAYVVPRTGADLFDVIKRLLATEEKVITVNLNYYEN